jgi:CRISPR/Cas system-associated exonuclease Cas4 (RecB family)
VIVEKIYDAAARQIKQMPVNSNRASDLGHPCVRYHVLNRTQWQQRAMHDVGLQMIFRMGNEIERIVLRELEEAGLTVIEQQRAFSLPEQQITGHIDGLIKMDDGIWPLEIKSCSPYVFKSINTVDDLTHGKYPYLRKYPAQLVLYCLMGNKEKGVIIFKDKTSGALKEIWVPLDYDLGEQLLKRAEATNAHVAAGTLPDPINDNLWCDGCAYAHICLPEHIGTEVEIDTGELATMLDRMMELKPAATEYKELDEAVSKAVEGREKVLAGGWFVLGKYCERKSYDIPAELKAQYEKITQYWRKTIKRAA